LVTREIAYRSLAARLREAIHEGQFADGRAMPTEDQLSAQYGISRSTVRRAMQELVADGVIYRVAGRGTYPVIDSDRYFRHFGSVEDLMGLSLDTDCVILSPLKQRVDIEAAGRLGLSSDSVMTLTLQRLYGAVPFVVTTVTLPPDVGGLLASEAEFTRRGPRSNQTVVGFLDCRLPSPITDTEQVVTATEAPPLAVAHLRCEPNSPVLRIDRLYSDANGRPVVLAVSYFNPTYYTYRVKLRRRAP
jgi:GntR family transcriptional regulator